MKYFDENGTKVTATVTTLNHFQVNEKDTSNNFVESLTRNRRSYY